MVGDVGEVVELGDDGDMEEEMEGVGEEAEVVVLLEVLVEGVPMMLSMVKPGFEGAVVVRVEATVPDDGRVIDDDDEDVDVVAGCADDKDGVVEVALLGDGEGEGDPFCLSCSSLLSSLEKWLPAAGGGAAMAGRAM